MNNERLYKMFKKDHPETIVEKDQCFDTDNYKDWLEEYIIKLETKLSERTNTTETSDKHEPKQLNILGVSESSPLDNLLIELQELSDTELEALRLVYEKEQGSVSLIQRRLKMGYRQADNIIDKLFNAGYITEYNGAKPRKITKHKKMMLNGIRLVLNSR